MAFRSRAALALSVTFAMFAIGGMGGGDAKLIAASSLWMGFSLNLLVYLIASTMIGGVLTLLILSYRNSPLADLTGRNMFLRHFADRKAGIPYGLALGLGGLMTYPDSPLVQWAIEQISSH